MEEASTPRETETSLSHIGSSGDAGKIPKGNWVKSCETSFERESDGMVMAGELVSAEKLDEHTRVIIWKGLNTSA